MSDVGSAANREVTASDAESPTRGGPRPVSLVDLLEERVSGLVDRYRGAQKSADELRSRLDAAEAELSALHTRVEEADRLRGALRERVQLLVEQVRRLEESAPLDPEAGADG